jgi:hypothetical protein
MTDFPKIYISCTVDDYDQSINLFLALAEKGFQSSMSIFDRTTAYLYCLEDDSLPGESKEAVQQRNQDRLNEVKRSSNIFLIVLSIDSLALEENRIHINSECEFALKLQKESEYKSFRLISIIVSNGGYIINEHHKAYPPSLSDITPLKSGLFHSSESLIR